MLLNYRVLLLLFVFTPSMHAFDQIRVRLEASSPQGTPISEVGVGQDFLLNAYVKDLRPLNPQGVFASYLDINYTGSILESADRIDFAPEFSNGRTGDVSMPGILDEVGGFGGFDAPGGEEQLLFSVPFNASKDGQAFFATGPAESVGGDMLLYGLDEPVDIQDIEFGFLSLDVSSNVCGFGTPGDIDGDGAVDFVDFVILSANFGKTNATFDEGDLDCNGEVQFPDFLILSGNFGTRPEASVPEPSGLVLGFLGLSLLPIIRRRS